MLTGNSGLANPKRTWLAASRQRIGGRPMLNQLQAGSQRAPLAWAAASRSPAKGSSSHQTGTNQLTSTCIRPASSRNNSICGRASQRSSSRKGLARSGRWGPAPSNNRTPMLGNSASIWVSKNSGGPLGLKPLAALVRAPWKRIEIQPC